MSVLVGGIPGASSRLGGGLASVGPLLVPEVAPAKIWTRTSCSYSNPIFGAVDLACDIAGSSTMVDGLRVTQQLTLSVSGIGTMSEAMRVTQQFSETITGASSMTAGLTVIQQLTSTVNGTATMTIGLRVTTRVDLAINFLGRGTMAANLRVRIPAPTRRRPLGGYHPIKTYVPYAKELQELQDIQAVEAYINPHLSVQMSGHGEMQGELITTSWDDIMAIVNIVEKLD